MWFIFNLIYRSKFERSFVNPRDLEANLKSAALTLMLLVANLTNKK